MKPKLITVSANINNKRLLIQGKTLSFEIKQPNFNKINANLWLALVKQSKKIKAKYFDFELDKEELTHLYGLGKKLEAKKEIKQAPCGLKAISIHAPYAYAICKGLKDEEYRTQPTKIRGWVLIHASLSEASDHDLKTYGLNYKEVKRGCIIGAAFINDCIGSNRDYAYLISEYKLFEKPIRISGKQCIFWQAKDKKEQQAFDKAYSMI